VVSRDVVFDETKGWNWTRDDSTQDGEGSFKVMIEDFGDHELKEKEGDADTIRFLQNKMMILILRQVKKQ